MSAFSNIKQAWPFITDGFVMDTEDPDQMGRLKIWCPALDGENYSIANLVWAEYATPFGGVTVDFPAGRTGAVSHGPVSYGFWALPKINSQVLVFLLNGDPNRRFYFASVFDLHRNRSLPGGRISNKDRTPGPWTDSYDPLEPASSNAKAAFGDLTGAIAQTRGPFERQVAQDADVKDGTNGYGKSPADNTYLDPQTYCWTTPGHHFISMSDNVDNCRVRVKTCEGNQVILDDTNERIYVSTAKGNTWIELDEDGHVHIYGAKSISVRAEEDINLAANRNINLNAQGTINLLSEADTNISGSGVHLKAGGQLAASGCKVDINSTDTKISGDQVNIKSGALLALSGYEVTANSHKAPADSDKDQVVFPGGDAAEAICANAAIGPSIIPAHEPFERPVNTARNSHYKG
jgi:hypothetical protein